MPIEGEGCVVRERRGGEGRDVQRGGVCVVRCSFESVRREWEHVYKRASLCPSTPSPNLPLSLLLPPRWAGAVQPEEHECIQPLLDYADGVMTVRAICEGGPVKVGARLSFVFGDMCVRGIVCLSCVCVCVRGVCLVRYTSGDQYNRSMGVALESRGLESHACCCL